MSEQRISLKEQEPPVSAVEKCSGEKPAPPLFSPPSQLPYWRTESRAGNWQRGKSGHSPAMPHPYARRPGPWIMLIAVLLFAVVICGTFFLMSSPGLPFGIAATSTRHYTVSANPMLLLANDTGSIHVHAGTSGHDVTIRLTKHSWWRESSDTRVIYGQNIASNTLSVKVERPANGRVFPVASLDFDLTVPSVAALQLTTSTGSIDVSGVSGQMTLVSNTGSIRVSNGTLKGPSRLITNTGSVTFNGAPGRTGTYQFQTHTGSINLTIPGTSVFHVDATTSTGSINISFPGVAVVRHQFTGADAHGDVGYAPQAFVILKTGTGSISLNRR